MRTREKKGLIIRAICELSKRNPKQHGTTHDQIVEETGLEFDTVDLYLEAMKRSGHITATRVSGGWTGVVLTAEMVLALEDIESQQAAAKGIGFPVQKKEETE